VRGDFFGGRSLITREEIDPSKAKLYAEQKKAKLTIIANSASVTLYCIDKRKLVFVPDNIVNALKEGLSLSKEFDEHRLDEKLNDLQDWQKFKNHFLKEAYTDAYGQLLRNKEFKAI
jgi:hypothetical protein